MAGEFDYIIIGAGASGCVLAARLTELASNRVLLLEAGGKNSDWRFRVPGAAGLAGLLKSANWGWKTEAEPGLDGRSISLSQGRGIGGSSSINGLMYVRGHSNVYDRWASEGCEGWAFKDVLPYFKRSERNSRGESRLHGGSGEMGVRPSRNSLPICTLFLEAAAEAGFPIVDDLNSDMSEGFGYYDMNVDKGVRASASSTFLKAAEHRSNLTIWTSTLVNRVIIEDGAAVGVEIVREGRTQVVRAGREVIVCAGAVESPRILLASGIGDRDHLTDVGIETLHHSPDVGRNLQNHPFYALSYLCKQPVTGQILANPVRAVREGITYLMTKDGLLAESILPVGGFFALNEGQDFPDVQVMLMPALLLQAGMGREITVMSLLRQPHGFLVAVNIGSPASRGSVSLRSADPRDPAKVKLNIYEDPSDIERMLQVVRKTRKIMQQSSIAAVIEHEISPGADADDDVLLERRLRSEGATMYHQCGTCRMGGDGASVVDTRLRVRGISQLRVADASIIPIIPNGNVHAAAIMIGERAADFISGRNHAEASRL